MVTAVDVANRALILIGQQKKISSFTQDSTEAQACAAFIDVVRTDLLRMAPWNCALTFKNLTYITSTPGTPENTSPVTLLWQKGQPAPPWSYEYQFPFDCLRACWIIPATQTGFTGVPVTTAVTGSAPNSWTGPASRFKVSLDQFYPVVAAAPATGGVNYSVGDIVFLTGSVPGEVPIGVPASLQVLTVDGGGAILTCNVIPEIPNSSTPQGGSYFLPQTNPVAQDYTLSIASFGTAPGNGTGATFNLTFSYPVNQRVILTNQEYPTLAYITDISDPNVMDSLFVDAWINALSARLAMVLVGDKNLANMCLAQANNTVIEARKADGNEGPTINDVTPDWIRIRGIAYPTDYNGYNDGPYFDWGGMFSLY